MWSSKTWYEVAVWWPSGSRGVGEYGGATRHETPDAAREAVRLLRRLGYGKVHNPIHTRKVTTEFIESESV